MLTEDTALEFKSLKGLPGPYMYVSYCCHLEQPPRLKALPYFPCRYSRLLVCPSSHCLSTFPRKYFLTALGHAGLNNLLAAYPDKTAYAVCTFAYCGGPGQDPILFHGRTEGKIVDARGPGVFGWDAVFEYQGETYAEMDKAKKVRSLYSFHRICRRKELGRSARIDEAESHSSRS